MVAITAAMADGTGLKRFKNLFPERFFDVGIAEEHAVTFAAGMAKAGLKPVFAVYSSFLQRAYDQVLHDVCTESPGCVCRRPCRISRKGWRHASGIFDLSYLSSIPNLTVMAPKNKWELSDMLKYAIAAEEPVAIRYPRGRSLRSLERSAGTDSKKAVRKYSPRVHTLHFLRSVRWWKPPGR